MLFADFFFVLSSPFQPHLSAIKLFVSYKENTFKIKSPFKSRLHYLCHNVIQNSSAGHLPHFSWYWQTQVLKIITENLFRFLTWQSEQNLRGESQKYSCHSRNNSCLRHQRFLPRSVRIVQTYRTPNSHLGLDISHSSLKFVNRFPTWHRTRLTLFQNWIPVQNFLAFIVFS